MNRIPDVMIVTDPDLTRTASIMFDDITFQGFLAGAATTMWAIYGIILLGHLTVILKRRTNSRDHRQKIRQLRAEQDQAFADQQQARYEQAQVEEEQARAQYLRSVASAGVNEPRTPLNPIV